MFSCGRKRGYTEHSYYRVVCNKPFLDPPTCDKNVAPDLGSHVGLVPR